MKGKEDMDRILAWKGALVFLGGFTLMVAGLAIFALQQLIGAILSVIGIVLFVLNILSVIKSNSQHKAVKGALIVPKVFFFVVLLAITLFFWSQVIFR